MKTKLTPDLIYGFVNSLLISRFDNPKPTPDFHLELWNLMCDPHDKVAIAAPRGHAKSTAVTHSFVLANVCFRVKKHILILSDTEGQAVNFLKDIKAELLENEELISLFGVTGLSTDREAEIVVTFADGRAIDRAIKRHGGDRSNYYYDYSTNKARKIKTENNYSSFRIRKLDVLRDMEGDM